MGFDSINSGGACDGFWRWLKPPHYNFFKEPCNIHDQSYNIGGNKLSRHIADRTLKYNMVEIVNKHFYKRKRFSRLWFLFLCKCY